MISLSGILRSRKFAIAAFLIPLWIRSIPEILVGPYQVGWDTLAFYAPDTLDWATGRLGLDSEEFKRSLAMGLVGFSDGGCARLRLDYKPLR